MRIRWQYALVAVLLLAYGLPVRGQDAYRMRSDRIEVDGTRHWDAWDFAFGTVTVDSLGVTANRVLREHNASLDASGFPIESKEKTGGAFAGSNSRSAAAVLDDDPHTFWEPDLGRAPETWWVEVDLGRAVSARRVVLRFVDEGEGDPFYQFKVLVSDGANIALTEQRLFREVGRTESTNRNQREFSFDLVPGKTIDGVFEGDVIQHVHVFMTDSREDRAEEIKQSDYDLLPASEKGYVQHFGRDQDGTEWEVEKEIYNLLDSAQQGQRHFYRRERPRLAELQVWTFGENVIQGTYARGGVVTGDRTGHTLSVDGNFNTSYEVQDAFGYALSDPEERILVDLGSFYWLDRIRSLFGNLFTALSARTFRSYRLLISDGSLAPNGTLLWQQLDARQDMRAGIFHEIRFPLSKVRYIAYSYDIIEIPGASHGQQVSIREIQSFGGGYQPYVELESPLIDLGSLRNLTTIHWQAEEPPGTRIEISTRTGNETDITQTFYRKGTSDPISETVYNGLPSSFKGPIDTTIVEGSDWSEWSRPVETSGDQVVSPSPRRLMKVRARLASEDPEQTAVLQQLEVRFNRAWVTQALGEVYPTHLEALGEKSPLTLFLFPRRGATSQGIDEILVTTTGQVPLSLRRLRLGTAADLAAGAGTVEAGVEVMPTNEDTLWVRLPSVVGRNQLVALDMNTVVFGQGTALSAQLGNTSSSGAWQRVDPDQGVVKDIQSGVLQVLGPPGDPRVQGLVLSTPVVTPNGDGVNDAVKLTFDVLRVDGARAVRAQVYDLSGRRLWEEVQVRPRASGSYQMRWAGVDVGGAVVTPGVYVLRLSVDAQRDAAATETLKPIHVVY